MIFLDTSGIIAISDNKDLFYEKAFKWWNNNQQETLITSNLVILETLGWIRYKRGHKLAIKVGKHLLEGSGIQIERITEDDEQRSWQLFQTRTERGLSLIDCTSAVLCKRRAIKNIFTFDTDFKNLGFILIPS